MDVLLQDEKAENAAAGERGSELQDALAVSAAALDSMRTPFEQWSVDEACRLIKSIDGVGYVEAAPVVKEIGINGKYFAKMLRANDEVLTKSIADNGIGLKQLQLHLLKKYAIEEIQGC